MVLSTMVIDAVTPRGGAETTAVVVTGKGFGVAAGRVVFSPLGVNIDAAVTLWQDDQIDFTVPAGVLTDQFSTLLLEKAGAADSANIQFWIPATPPAFPSFDYQYPRFDQANPNVDDPYIAQAADFNRLLDRAVASAAGLPPFIGSVGGVPPVLVEEPDGVLSWKCLTINDLCDAFGVTLTANASSELGQSSVNPTFNAFYSGAVPPVFSELSDNDGNPVQDILGVPNPITRPHTYVKTTISASVSFTVTANDGDPNQNDLVTHTWLPRTFWGVGPAGGSTEAFIEALASSALAANRQRTFTTTPGATDKIYYAYPDAYGAGTFFVNNFEGGFLPSTLVSVTNPFGVTLSYRLYESALINLGTTTVQVT